MHKDSTKYERDLLSRFRSNPVGLEVILSDGPEGEVTAFRDGPRGREVKVRGVRSWVPLSRVVELRYYVASIAPGVL